MNTLPLTLTQTLPTLIFECNMYTDQLCDDECGLNLPFTINQIEESETQSKLQKSRKVYEELRLAITISQLEASLASYETLSNSRGERLKSESMMSNVWYQVHDRLGSRREMLSGASIW